MTTHQEKVISAVNNIDSEAGSLASAVYGKFTGKWDSLRRENAEGAIKLEKAVQNAIKAAKGQTLSDQEKLELKEGFKIGKEFLQNGAKVPAPSAEQPTNPENSPQNPNTPTPTPLEVAAQTLDKTIGEKTTEWANEQNAAKRNELKNQLDELKTQRKELQKLIDESKPKDKSEGITQLEGTIQLLNSSITEAQRAWIAEKDPEKQKPLKARLDALQAELRETENKLAAAKRTENQEETAEQREAKAKEREDARKKQEEERKAEQEQREKERKAEKQKRDAEQRIRDQALFRESEIRKLSNLITSNRDVRDAERGILLSPVSKVKRDLMRSEATKNGVDYDNKDSWEVIFKKIIDKKVTDRFPEPTKTEEEVKDDKAA